MNKKQKALFALNVTLLVISSATVGVLTAVMIQKLIEAGYVVMLPLSPLLPII